MSEAPSNKSAPIDPSVLISGYLEDKLTTQQFESLTRWIHTSRENARVFMRHFVLVEHIREELRWDDIAEVPIDELDLTDDSQDAMSALKDLCVSEKLAEPDLTLLIQSAFEASPAKANEQSITARELLSMSGWLFGQAVRSRAGIITGLAAAVLLGVVLTIALIGPGRTSGPAETAGNRSVEPDVPASLPIVATLTAEHDAQWDRRPGQNLYAGDRFTLTKGFATITTQRGAVAILESPATIEFIDSPNALRLHAGKLVGVCETAMSKGFLVRTPHMDVVDLGTRFGVNTSSDSTHVHVYEGAVQAIGADASLDATPMRLGAGESVGYSTGSNALIQIEHNTDVFAALLPPSPRPLRGTGEGLKDNEIDTNWLVTSEDGKPLATSVPMHVSDFAVYKNIRPRGSSGARWLEFNPNTLPSSDHPTVTYLIQTTIDLAVGLDPDKTRLDITYIADNLLAAVHVNGERVAVSDVNDMHPRSISIDRHLRPGRNTIVFELQNTFQQGFENANKLALYIDWSVQKG